MNSIQLIIEEFVSNLYSYIKKNIVLISILVIVTIAAYGFELFNFNLTIDEEIHATYTGATTAWISQGRWGMYFLNRFLLPHTVVPFVPLFLALLFEIGAILLILDSWGVQLLAERLIIGSVCIAFPGLAFMYTFSTINYGIGFGLFCTALSLFVFVKSKGWMRFLAIIPAAYAISIYQGFILALIAVFLVYIISAWIQSGRWTIKDFGIIVSINLAAVLLYYAIEKLIFLVGSVPPSTYVDQYFDVSFLKDNFSYVVRRLSSFMFQVYSGNKHIYGDGLPALGFLLVLSLLGLAVKILISKARAFSKVIIILFSLGLIILPFVSGLLMRGYMAMRFLVALPVVLVGLLMLGMMVNHSKTLHLLFGLLSAVCILQFIVSTNRLFASSYLALQEDRLLASSLIQRIEETTTEAGNVEGLKYMETIGYLNRPSSELMPEIETFGASFFGWDQGNTARELLFMQTLGYQGLQPLPSERRGQMIEIAKSMPVWPEAGSVSVVGDTVLIKFSNYSDSQIVSICESSPSALAPGFCK